MLQDAPVYRAKIIRFQQTIESPFVRAVYIEADAGSRSPTE